MKFIIVKDPITLDSFDEIPKQNLIKLTVGNKLRFYNIRSLYKWLQFANQSQTGERFTR